MSAKAVDESTRFGGSWQDFFRGEKEWAYWEDQLVTTHPIEGVVANTNVAHTVFDGITYGKGASVLKQLHYYLGEDEFKDGLNRYFQKYAFRNTQLTDFIKMLSEASGRDLSKWQQSWLQTSGVNGLRAEWKCDEDKLSEFKLVQTPAEGSNEVRPHRTKIGFFYPSKNGQYVASETIELQYAKAENPILKEIRGKACPAFVYPNYDDYDYVKVELDPKSLETVSKGLRHVENPFTRQMLWHTLWEMVVDGKLKTQDYASIVISQIADENDTQILSKVLRTYNADQSSVLQYLAGDARAKALEQFETFAEKHLDRSAPNSDQQIIWFKAWMDTVHTDRSKERLAGLLSGKAKIKGLKLEQDRRWEVIGALSRSGFEKAADLIEAELKQDPTENGIKASVSAEASIPKIEAKKKWIGEILKRLNFKSDPADKAQEQPLSLGKLREAMGSLNQLGQEALTQQWMGTYFENLSKLAATGDEEFASRFAGSMFPSICEQYVIDRTAEVLKSQPDLSARITRKLRVAKQEQERCVRARALSIGAPVVAPSGTP